MTHIDLPTLVGRCLADRGDRVALEAGPEAWTYDELDRETRSRALTLRRAVPEGGRVILIGEHTADALISALAVMRSGLVYTPVAGQLPAERMGEALDVASPALVVCCTPDAADRVRLARPASRIVLAGELVDPAVDPAVDRESPGPPIAYSIFTSGSAGRPKLVNVGHRGVVGLCHAQAAIFAVTPGQRVLQFSSLSFDASVAEILVTLFAGATLVVPARVGNSWVAAVAHYLCEHGCDLVTLPPSVYARLDEAARRKVGTVVFAGEALSRVEYEQAARHSRVFNAYGPTEGTVCFSVCEPTEFTSSVGRPIAGYSAYVYRATDGGRYATSGRGELVIVGEAVALGYDGADDAAGPFTRVEGTPAYHTGDEVELRDGEVFFQGRIDDQVKRLGHRLNLTDVGHRLSDLLQARAIAFMHDGSLVMAHTASGWTVERVRELCAEALPPWEAPDLVLCLDHMPLTVAGKADTNALRALADEAVSRAQTGTETAVQATRRVVTQALGAPIDDDVSIFDAGGTSFTLVQIQVALAEQFGEEPVQQAFDRMDYDFSIAAFVSAIEGVASPSPTREVVESVAVDVASLCPAGARRRGDGITVTGAGGFIGGHVLDRVLGAGGPVTIVTGTDPDRLVARHATRFGRPSSDYTDLRFLRYDEVEYGSEPWGTVVHCGFDVNHVLPLAWQMKTSVVSARAMVRAAAAHHAHRFVYLSAASVGSRFLAFRTETLDAIADPYSQAKFVGEAYVEALAGEVCTVDILRAGLVYGHRTNEAGLLSDDVFASLLRLSARHGILPRLAGLIPVCHVDDVVDAMLVGGDAPGRREILVHRTYDLDSVREEIGLDTVPVVDPSEWLRVVAASGDAAPAVVAGLRMWLREDVGWQKASARTDRPILAELFRTVTG